jgi:choline dehydrogenase-like flavoprotein
MTFSDRPAGLTVKLATSSSAGGLWITSADPAAPPTIELNLLGSQADVGLMRAAVRHLAILLSHDTWKGLGRRAVSAQTGTTLKDIVAADDRTLAGLLLREVVDGFHLTSTCRMGTPEDGTSVVDGEGRVHGTDHLRVVDVSICPTIVRANTHLTAVMVAERFAELLA